MERAVLSSKTRDNKKTVKGLIFLATTIVSLLVLFLMERDSTEGVSYKVGTYFETVIKFKTVMNIERHFRNMLKYVIPIGDQKVNIVSGPV